MTWPYYAFGGAWAALFGASAVCGAWSYAPPPPLPPASAAGGGGIIACRVMCHDWGPPRVGSPGRGTRHRRDWCTRSAAHPLRTLERMTPSDAPPPGLSSHKARNERHHQTGIREMAERIAARDAGRYPPPNLPPLEDDEDSSTSS